LPQGFEAVVDEGFETHELRLGGAGMVALEDHFAGQAEPRGDLGIDRPDRSRHQIRGEVSLRIAGQHVEIGAAQDFPRDIQHGGKLGVLRIVHEAALAQPSQQMTLEAEIARVAIRQQPGHRLLPARVITKPFIHLATEQRSRPLHRIAAPQTV